MTRILLALFAALLLAAPAAANTWTDCVGNTGGELSTITKYNLVCLDCTDSAGADDCVDTRVFHIRAKSALICFNPDTAASEGADAAQIKIRNCSSGTKPAANPEYSCHSITTAAITGVTGSAGTQDACQRVATGTYFIDFIDDGGAGDTPQVTIQGEGD